jgi:undecaprenyl-diphosphatase
MIEPIVLGIIQGITEWIPVSSKGSVSLAGSLLFGRNLADAFLFALWLHIGTAIAAIVYFRKRLTAILMEFLRKPFPLPPMAQFLLVSTLVTGIVGFPALLLFEETSASMGYAGSGVIGGFMLITGLLQLRQKAVGVRTSADIRPADGVLAGLAQACASVPGLSRSGATIALLLARGFDRREALALSFLMSVPVTLGAALYGGVKSGAGVTTEGVVGGAAAFVIGLATMRGLLAVAGRVNFGAFVFGTGAVLVLLALFQIFWF